jgi:hypothetical protein
MSAEPLVVPRGSLRRRLQEAHRPRRHVRGLEWPADPAYRLLVRTSFAVPFVVIAVLLALHGGAPGVTPNEAFGLRATALPWAHADPTWVGHLYPPITTVLAAVVPGGATGMTVVGALVAGVLLHAVIEGMRQRGFALSSTVVFAIALAANPLFAYAATENLPAFLGIGLFGLGFADLVRFTTERDTQSGFRAGILLMLAALSDPSGVVYVVAATLAAPLLSAGRGRGVARGSANTLVVLFPTLSAFGAVMLLEWIFAGDPFGVVRALVVVDPARLAILQQLFTTPLGWLWLASMAGTWAIGLVVGRPGAVLLTFLLFSALVGGYLLGLIPENAAGTIYLMMMLAAIGIVPAASNTPLTLTVNALAVLELAVAWLTALNRPIVVDWLTALLQGRPG